MASRVEGVFRSPGQVEQALKELRERGLNRDVSLRADRRGTTAGGIPGLDLSDLAEAPDMVLAGALSDSAWPQQLLRLIVTTSPRKGPEVAQLLRQCGAEEVDLT